MRSMTPNEHSPQHEKTSLSTYGGMSIQHSTDQDLHRSLTLSFVNIHAPTMNNYINKLSRLYILVRSTSVLSYRHT